VEKPAYTEYSSIVDRSPTVSRPCTHRGQGGGQEPSATAASSTGPPPSAGPAHGDNGIQGGERGVTRLRRQQHQGRETPLLVDHPRAAPCLKPITPASPTRAEGPNRPG
jgi:hypothetical protein